jgi:integrase
MVGGKRRHIGMGAYPKFSLAQAREKASKARELIEQGIDPIEHKKAVRSAIKAEQAKGVTFRQCAVAYMDAHSHAWGSIKHAKQWGNTLSTYAYPAIGSMLVKDVTQAHILAILRPIWQEKTDTAKRVRNRIELVLDYAIASGYREDSNPARWKGKLDKLLPVPAKIAKVRHHKAVPVDEMPAFIEQLSMNESMAARCLLFCILTACRSGEARGAVWSEIDMDARVWTIPAERMKAGKDHQVPLSDQAMELLCSLPRVMGDGRVFPPAKGKMLSDATLSILMRKMGRVEVPHGFRSTFRDWAGDRTNYPRDLAEAALAHTLPNQVEAAYRRGTALEKRRSMMNDWAGYIFSGRQADSSVIQFKKGVA